ncbi:Uu.00g059790.m01.CDS01 [Anthostomella pinea]|uniref:Uu.00g059790.m01.CDS01 n=1 Tax=Anthostomella pinea TaxID=933095 RepID=A0AAI8VSY7_9PEZI|nr:Uu.00g059790.m01.CDS01 [Anthostomella pinea]
MGIDIAVTGTREIALVDGSSREVKRRLDDWEAVTEIVYRVQNINGPQQNFQAREFDPNIDSNIDPSLEGGYGLANGLPTPPVSPTPPDSTTDSPVAAPAYPDIDAGTEHGVGFTDNDPFDDTAEPNEEDAVVKEESITPLDLDDSNPFDRPDHKRKRSQSGDEDEDEDEDEVFVVVSPVAEASGEGHESPGSRRTRQRRDRDDNLPDGAENRAASNERTGEWQCAFGCCASYGDTRPS